MQTIIDFGPHYLFRLISPNINPFTPVLMKRALPSLNLDTLIVTNMRFGQMTDSIDQDVPGSTLFAYVSTWLKDLL